MCAKFLRLALITDDDSALLLASLRQKRRQSGKSLFNFDQYDKQRCKIDFRFEKEDILRLKSALDLPEIMRTADRRKFSSLEGLCLMLRRLAYPNRLADLQVIFGRSKSALSVMFNMMLDFVFQRYRFLITSLNLWWLERPYLHLYANAVARKGAPLQGCFGFIDGTVHRICRPSRHQQEAYSGHKRVHCLKYQSTVVANGLIANLHGPEPGRRHDSFMLRRSEILEKFQNLIGADNLYIYGDSGYPLKRFLITPCLGNNLTPEQVEFNERMSRVRICVEWEFAHLYEQFAFLCFKQNQKLFLQPVGKYYVVATILKNCKTCLYGSQTSAYFNCQPPTLEQYLSNNKDI